MNLIFSIGSSAATEVKENAKNCDTASIESYISSLGPVIAADSNAIFNEIKALETISKCRNLNPELKKKVDLMLALYYQNYAEILNSNDPKGMPVYGVEEGRDQFFEKAEKIYLSYDEHEKLANLYLRWYNSYLKAEGAANKLIDFFKKCTQAKTSYPDSTEPIPSFKYCTILTNKPGCEGFDEYQAKFIREIVPSFANLANKRLEKLVKYYRELSQTDNKMVKRSAEKEIFEKILKELFKKRKSFEKRSEYRFPNSIDPESLNTDDSLVYIGVVLKYATISPWQRSLGCYINCHSLADEKIHEALDTKVVDNLIMAIDLLKILNGAGYSIKEVYEALNENDQTKILTMILNALKSYPASSCDLNKAIKNLMSMDENKLKDCISKNNLESFSCITEDCKPYEELLKLTASLRYAKNSGNLPDLNILLNDGNPVVNKDPSTKKENPMRDNFEFPKLEARDSGDACRTPFIFEHSNFYVGGVETEEEKRLIEDLLSETPTALLNKALMYSAFAETGCGIVVEASVKAAIGRISGLLISGAAFGGVSYASYHATGNEALGEFIGLGAIPCFILANKVSDVYISIVQRNGKAIGTTRVTRLKNDAFDEVFDSSGRPKPGNSLGITEAEPIQGSNNKLIKAKSPRTGAIEYFAPDSLADSAIQGLLNLMPNKKHSLMSLLKKIAESLKCKGKCSASIQTPNGEVPIPENLEPFINRVGLKNWIDQQVIGLRTVCSKIVANIRRISFSEFLNNLRITVDKFNNYIKSSKDKRWVHAIIDKGKSNQWVYDLASQNLKSNPQAQIVMRGNNNKQQLFDLFDRGIRKFVMFDDASYSGDQLITEFRNPIIKAFKEWLRLYPNECSNLEIIAVVPHSTSSAKSSFEFVDPFFGVSYKSQMITNDRILSLGDILTTLNHNTSLLFKIV